MKLELCSFSGYKIYPGHEKRYIKSDGKVFHFLGSKCGAAFALKKNPRKVSWTVLYRRKHKKGIEVEQAKKRTRRTVQHQRAIVGASLADIMAKRNMRPEVRKAQREQAIRIAKEKKREKVAEKHAQKAQKAKTDKKVDKKKANKPVVKNVQKAAPRVGGKR